MPRLRAGSSGPFVETGDALSSLVWVDPSTTVPPAERNGSAAAPFATLQTAAAAIVASGVANATIALVDGNYAAMGLLLTGLPLVSLQLQGFGGAVNLGVIELDGTIGLQLANVGSQTTVGVATVRGVGGAPSLLARSSHLGSIVEVVYSLIDSIVAGEISTTSAGSAVGCDLRGVVSSLEFDATECDFTGLGVTAAALGAFNQCRALVGTEISGSDVRLAGCLWTGQILASGPVQLIDVYFSAPSLIDAAAGAIEARNVRFAGDVLAGSLIIDSVSQQAARAGGVTFTIAGATQVSDAPVSATVSIVVPAVAADAVGYVNTSLVGTPLEGVFTVAGQAVHVNPESDLVAAGAGGGFINARISAADTLRCAFHGQLAGGAANFTVARVR